MDDIPHNTITIVIIILTQYALEKPYEHLKEMLFNKTFSNIP